MFRFQWHPGVLSRSSFVLRLLRSCRTNQRHQQQKARNQNPHPKLAADGMPTQIVPAPAGEMVKTEEEGRYRRAPSTQSAAVSSKQTSQATLQVRQTRILALEMAPPNRRLQFLPVLLPHRHRIRSFCKVRWAKDCRPAVPDLAASAALAARERVVSLPTFPERQALAEGLEEEVQVAAEAARNASAKVETERLEVAHRLAAEVAGGFFGSR